MSDAPFFTASVRIALISFTTGASSTAAASAAAETSSSSSSTTSTSPSSPIPSMSSRSDVICVSVASKIFSSAFLIVNSPAITGKMSYRVMNLRSSSTPRFVGSAIATVSVRPSRLSGSTRCFNARSPGISFAIRGSTSNLDRSTAGILNCRASILVNSVS